MLSPMSPASAASATAEVSKSAASHSEEEEVDSGAEQDGDDFYEEFRSRAALPNILGRRVGTNIRHTRVDPLLFNGPASQINSQMRRTQQRFQQRLQNTQILHSLQGGDGGNGGSLIGTIGPQGPGTLNDGIHAHPHLNNGIGGPGGGSLLHPGMTIGTYPRDFGSGPQLPVRRRRANSVGDEHFSKYLEEGPEPPHSLQQSVAVLCSILLLALVTVLLHQSAHEASFWDNRAWRWSLAVLGLAALAGVSGFLRMVVIWCLTVGSVARLGMRFLSLYF